MHATDILGAIGATLFAASVVGGTITATTTTDATKKPQPEAKVEATVPVEKPVPPQSTQSVEDVRLERLETKGDAIQKKVGSIEQKMQKLEQLLKDDEGRRNGAGQPK